MALYDIMVKGRVAVFVILIYILVISAYYIYRAIQGKTVWLKRIYGIDAIEEAVARSVELGRPCHFGMGYGGYGLASSKGSAHIAAVSLVDYVSKLTAKYKTDLVVSYCWPEFYPVLHDTLAENYLAEGRSLTEGEITSLLRYFPTRGFGIGAMGTIEALKPGANFIFGWVWGEAMLMGEAAAYVGAMQVASSADYNYGICWVLAFSDYALFPEELFVAGAYCSRDNLQQASIRGADFAKFLLLASAVISLILGLMGNSIWLDLLNT